MNTLLPFLVKAKVGQQKSILPASITGRPNFLICKMLCIHYKQQKSGLPEQAMMKVLKIAPRGAQLTAG
jgi:hypothetical protein